MSGSDELKQMTERAMAAEARVAELLEEQSRIGGSKPLSGSLSSSSGDSQLRRRAESAEAERADLQAQKRKLEHELEEAEEELRKVQLELDKAKGHQEQDTSDLEEQIKNKDEELAKLSSDIREKDQLLQNAQRELEAGMELKLLITRLEAELKEARAAAATPPPPPPADTSGLEEQLKSREEQLAGLSSAIREKEAQIDELSQRVDAIPIIEAERDGLAREIEKLRAQEAQPKAQPEQDSAGVVEHLKAELDEMAEKEAASADTAKRLARENAQLLAKLSAARREHDELVKQMESTGDLVTIVSHARKDGTQPETVAPPPVAPERSQPVMGLLVEGPPDDDVPEDSLPELEPLPAPPLVRRPSKGGWFLKLFLFLVLAGGAFLAAWHFLPGLLNPPADKPKPAEVITPPEPAPPAEVPEIPEEPAEAAPEESPSEDPADKVVKKKSPTKKPKPKKTAKASEPEMTVGEAKRQVRRLIAGKQLDQAQKLLTTWVKKHPRDAGLHYLYGRLHLLRGNKSAAVDQLEEAIELAPKMASAYHDLGAIYLQMGENDLACETLGHFVRLKPKHQRTPAILDLMKKIKCP